MNRYIVISLLACFMFFAQTAFSGDAITKTVEGVITDQSALNGKIVKIKGKVVKVC